MSQALASRLRKVERNPGRRASPLPCTVILTEDDADQARQLADRKAAGTYKPSWPLIVWRIVDPIPRRHP
jgi:hypothetical protein